MRKGPISRFLDDQFLHFNAASLVDAARAYCDQLDSGNKMMVTLAGAMSTAELGKSLAEMIRRDKVHIISCTGANLEEDIMNLVAHSHYERIAHYRDLSPQQEVELYRRGLNRVTDTCIPEEEAVRKLEDALMVVWKNATEKNKSYLPHEYFYQLLGSGVLTPHHDTDPHDSWLVAACEMNIPIIVPGWEDSTLGNIFASKCIEGALDPLVIKGGIEYMTYLANWYQATTKTSKVGFFQIGGGIAGDFPICVVPLLKQDLKQQDVPFWSYFCQISDSITSYGSYSGAVPNEKITWGKLDADTPRFVIESDATIVTPLIFAYVLNH